MKEFDLEKNWCLECSLCITICATLAPEYLSGFHPYVVRMNKLAPKIWFLDRGLQTENVVFSKMAAMIMIKFY
jgi:hypothetical protein